MDVLEMCISIISNGLDWVEVSSNLPNPHPQGPYVTISRIGGKDTMFLLKPTIEILCWEQTDQKAYALARACIDALQQAIYTSGKLSSVDINTLARDEWAKTGQSRYRVVADLVVNI